MDLLQVAGLLGLVVVTDGQRCARPLVAAVMVVVMFCRRRLDMVSLEMLLWGMR